MSAGSGDLKIVATLRLGVYGSGESAVVVPWRWYDHVPAIPLLVPIVLPLVLVKSNRSWQAWLIVLPLLAVAILWRLLAGLLFMPPSSAETLGFFAVSLAAAWSVVWLLGDWLARLGKLSGLLVACALSLAMVSLSFVCHRGFAADMESLWMLVPLGWFPCALVFAAALSAYCCGGRYRASRFLSWLLLWMPLVSSLAGLLLVVPLIAVNLSEVTVAGLLSEVLMAGILWTVGAPLAGLGVFVLNLPFALLAVESPFYRDRFCRVLRLAELLPARPHAAPLAGAGGEGYDGASASPTCQQEKPARGGRDDVLGG